MHGRKGRLAAPGARSCACCCSADAKEDDVSSIAWFPRSAALAAMLVAAACAVPVKADDVGSEKVYSRLHENVLTGAEPSVAARLTIERAGLVELYENNPREALVALHRAAESADTRERLYGLAELSLAEGVRTDE